MSEEEAIEWVKALLQDKEKYEKYHSWVGTNTFVSIQTLLNLIDKQQKEISNYKYIITTLNDNWVSKPQIRDKIKNEEKEIKEIEYLQKIDNTMALCDEKAYRQHKIDTLKELLEE